MCKTTRTIVPKRNQQDIVLSFAIVFGWEGDALPIVGCRDPATGEKIPYRAKVVEGKTVHEIAGAEWIDVEDILRENIMLAHNQNGLYNVTVVDEMNEMYRYRTGTSAAFLGCLERLTAMGKAMRADRKRSI
jgi:hypothetical protein